MTYNDLNKYVSVLYDIASIKKQQTNCCKNTIHHIDDYIGLFIRLKIVKDHDAMYDAYNAYMKKYTIQEPLYVG